MHDVNLCGHSKSVGIKNKILCIASAYQVPMIFIKLSISSHHVSLANQLVSIICHSSVSSHKLLEKQPSIYTPYSLNEFHSAHNLLVL